MKKLKFEMNKWRPGRVASDWKEPQLNWNGGRRAWRCCARALTLCNANFLLSYARVHRPSLVLVPLPRRHHFAASFAVSAFVVEQTPSSFLLYAFFMELLTIYEEEKSWRRCRVPV